MASHPIAFPPLDMEAIEVRIFTDATGHQHMIGASLEFWFIVDAKLIIACPSGNDYQTYRQN